MLFIAQLKHIFNFFNLFYCVAKLIKVLGVQAMRKLLVVGHFAAYFVYLHTRHPNFLLDALYPVRFRGCLSDYVCSFLCLQIFYFTNKIVS